MKTTTSAGAEPGPRIYIYNVSMTITSTLYFQWAIPENIHTYTTDGFLDFRRGGGVHDYGILRTWGGIYVWKSEGMGVP